MTAKITRYPGSKPFTIEYKDLFFGRDTDIAAFSKVVQLEKLTVLYGKSGLGKSSLLNAGVVPRLTQYQPIFIRLFSFSEANQITPLERCRFAFQPHRASRQARYTAESPLHKIHSDPHSLWEACADVYWRLRQKSDAPTGLILIFDQFEELFTYPDGIDDFAHALAEVLTNRQPLGFRQALEQKLAEQPDLLSEDEWAFLESDIPIKVVFSIRSDHLNLLNRLTPFLPNVLRNCYELRPLSADAARLAIERPASLDSEQFDTPTFTYDPTFLNDIIDYLTQHGRKEIESFQLQIICQYIEGLITPDNRLIDAEDVPDLDEVYHNYYLNLIEQLAPEEQPIARHLIEEGLIFEAEQRRLSLYEGQITSGFNVSAELLRRLVDSRLLRAEPNPGGGFNYELCHDSLVKPILQAKALRVAEERELQRQEELRLAREKAEQERLARVRARRRSLAVISVVSVFALVSLVLAIVAFNKNEEARRQTENAQNAQREALKQAAEADAARQQAEEAMGLATSTNFLLEMKQDSLQTALISIEKAKKTADAEKENAIRAKAISDSLLIITELAKKELELRLKQFDIALETNNHLANHLTRIKTAMFLKGLPNNVDPKKLDGSQYPENLVEEEYAKIDSLDLSNNLLSRIPEEVNNCKNLRSLDLSGNEVSYIYSDDLANLTQLRTLNLGGNEIEDLSALAHLTQLQTLNLDRNEITDVSALANLTKLEFVDLRENPLSDEQVDALKKALPDCEIVY